LFLPLLTRNNSHLAKFREIAWELWRKPEMQGVGTKMGTVATSELVAAANIPLEFV
jgi:hypothetical protein